MSALFGKVDRLLHDAEHAEGGASMARAMGDGPNADSLAAKAKALRDEANQLDPDHTAPSWTDDQEDAQERREADERFASFLRRHHP